ncbi:MAG TPA: alpha/beta fold hydrolase, partial [Candidatus Limnocylindrales bacterium]
MPHVQVDGFRMYFERHGSQGEPLVLVHGYTGDVSDWVRQIEAFSASHRLLAMDHRGHGRSGAPPDRASYTVERLASD